MKTKNSLLLFKFPTIVAIVVLFKFVGGQGEQLTSGLNDHNELDLRNDLNNGHEQDPTDHESTLDIVNHHLGEDDDELHYGDHFYEDDLTGGEWGHGLRNVARIISEAEREEEAETNAIYGPLRRKPRIGKCCALGEGLDAQGGCRKLTEHEEHLHRETTWFPDRVIDYRIEEWTVPIESEWEVTAPTRILCGQPRESLQIISDTNLFVIVSNGKLFLPHHQKEVGTADYCIDLLLGRGRAVRTCFSQDELCAGSNCLRKCCPEGAMVEDVAGTCYFHPSTSVNRFPTDNYNVIHGSPICTYGQYKIPIGNDGSFNIGTNGNLLTSNAINASFLNYCLDFFVNLPTTKKRSVPENLSILDKKLDQPERSYHLDKGAEDSKKDLKTLSFAAGAELKAIICFDSPTDAISKRRNSAGLISVPREMSVTYGIAFILSSICIALAAFVSWKLPELRSLHGKCQLSHLATLFCLFVLLAVIHLGADSLIEYNGLCTILAVSLHTCTLSAFLWLNLLCVNIYLTFRSLRPPLAARRDENKRLLFLCLYAWGIPVSFCMFLYLLDGTPGRMEPMPRPEYGNHSCLISNRTAMFYYLYGPVGFLLVLNGILFCLTARELLCGLWRLDNSDSLAFRRKSMGIVVAKLGIVMGMGWILDVLSWAIGNKPYIFYIADLFNGLQGVFMFLVLIWRKRVLEVLKLRKPSLIKDETLTARPFLPSSTKNLILSSSALPNGGSGDPDTSLILGHQDI